MKPIEELEINMMGLSMGEVGIALVMTDGDIQEGIRKWIRKTEGRVPKLEKKEGLLMEHGRIWVPPDQEIKRQIVELNHDSPFTGHLGIKGTSDLVAKGYYWEGRDQYIRDYVTGCQTCIRAKKRNYRRHGMLNPLPNPEGPWLWTELDHIVKLPTSNGFDSIYRVWRVL